MGKIEKVDNPLPLKLFSNNIMAYLKGEQAKKGITKRLEANPLPLGWKQISILWNSRFDVSYSLAYI